MKLQTRLTLVVVILISITSTAIGYFSITTNYRSQVKNLDKSVTQIITELDQSTDDPLFLSTYLAEISSANISIDYLTSELDLIPLFESQAKLSDAINLKVLKRSMTLPVDVNDLRLRTFLMEDKDYLLIYYSLAELKESRSNLIEMIFIFTLILVILASLISLLIFRKDSQLNNLVNSLKHSHERMQEFIGDASHELKTPLTIIKGYFELIDNDKSDPEKIPTYKSRITSEILRMQEIINDLLFITELDETDKSGNKEFNLSDSLNDYIFDLKNFNPKREIESKVEQNIFINISQPHLAQILSNIFSNIKRHTPSDSRILISLEHKRDRAILIIEDSGKGLPKEFYIGGIQAFRRYDKSRSRESGGSGLGMTILEKTTRKNGGKVKLSPSRFGGLKIEIQFPIA